MVDINLTEAALMGQFADGAYDETRSLGYTPEGTDYELIHQDYSSISSFGGQAYYSPSDNRVVIAYKGTDQIQDLVVTDLLGPGLGWTGNFTNQDADSRRFTAEVLEMAQTNGAEISLTGHSLGGYHSQINAIDLTVAGTNVSGWAFNAPGVYGLSGETGLFINTDYPVNHIYTQFWGPVGGPIHSIGTRIGNDVFFVPYTHGHPIADILANIEKYGVYPLADYDRLVAEYGLVGFPEINNHCFKSDTPIQMWPLDPSIKPRADGTYDEQLVLSNVWEKPICDIRVGDLVISYDDKGRIKPGPVTRTMTNMATHLLDFWNTGVTPGHAYYCADGKFKDQHVPLMDILRTDGAIMRADGTMIRAATNCELGSMGDMMIHASATVQKPDGTWTEPNPGKVRFGTRIILPDGKHVSFMEMAASEGWKVTDDGYMVGMIKGEDGTVAERVFHFPYSHGEELPKPEDYILARSKVSLEAIYAAGEWEQIGTRMPAPAGMVGLNTNHTSTLLQPSKPEPNIPPAFADHPDAPRRPQGRSMNRKQRKAMEAKQRKAAKMRKRAAS